MHREDYTDMGGVREAFLTTHWTSIEEIGAGEDDRSSALVELLLARYWKPDSRPCEQPPTVSADGSWQLTAMLAESLQTAAIRRARRAAQQDQPASSAF